MYHSAWAWAGDSPFRYTKLIAADWGGTRTPMVISWPNADQARQDATAAVHHVNDVVPTLYEILGIKPPKVVDGHKQDPIDGVSFAYTFDSATAPEQKTDPVLRHHGQPRHLPQRLDGQHVRPPQTLGSRVPDISNWDPMQDQWELFNTRRDFR
jgi:arylsulfatase A-like enzyme